MRAFPWVMAGMGIGAGLTIMLINEYNEAEAKYAIAHDGVEGAARKTFGWGTKNRVAGTAESLMGSVKEGVGRFTGDDRMAVEGSAEQAAGSLREAAGTVGQAVGETVLVLNR
jgi:uncharacterized protein YjbJ (UPF0337 family)